MFRKIKQNFLLFIVTNFGWLIVYLICFSIKLEVQGEEVLNDYYKKGKRVIFTFWHDSQLFFVYYYRNKKIRVLISESRDGEYISRVIERFGFKAVRGSSSHGGMKSLLSLTKFISSGFDAGITPDGPKGPRHKLKEGVLFLSQKTGSPIIPICFSSDRKKKFNSWDKFLLPLPFSKGILIYGKPFIIPENCSKEEFNNYKFQIEFELNNIWDKANNYFF